METSCYNIVKIFNMKVRVLLVMALVTGIVAGKENGLSSVEQYRIGYTDGYEEGKRKGMEEGYRLALEDFRKVYQEKLQEYTEIEAGKLLIKEARISFPRVYMVGGERLVVSGCQVIKPVDDLLAKIPQREFGEPVDEQGLPIKGVPLKPYTRVKFCGEESRIRQFSPVYYRKEGSGCYVVYFEEREGLEELCKLGECRR